MTAKTTDTPFTQWARKAASIVPCPVCGGSGGVVQCPNCSSSGRILLYPEMLVRGLVEKHEYCGNGACWNDPFHNGGYIAGGPQCGGSGYMALYNPLLVLDWLKQTRHANIELVSGGSNTPWFLFQAGWTYGPVVNAEDAIHLAATQTLGAETVWAGKQPQNWISRIAIWISRRVFS